jgi:hypothetical protein
MNRKQLLILLVVVVVVGVFGWMRYRHSQDSWQGGGAGVSKKLLGDLPVNDVTKIVIKGGTNELDLVKKDDRWRVKQRSDYPANYVAISGFLLKAADLKAIQVEEVEASQLPRYKLLPAGADTNTAVSVDLFDKNGKSLGSLLLGKTHLRKGQGRPSPMGEMGENEGYPDGRYVMTSPSSKFVAVISEPFSDFGAKPESWLGKDFFKVEKIKSFSVTYPNPTNSWKLSRDTDTATGWKLSEAKAGEQVDSAKTASFSSALNSPTFNDVVPSDSPQAAASLEKPTQITIDTFDHLEYALKIGQKTNAAYPVLVTVTGNLPKERVAGKDEKPEDKAKLDKEFADQQKTAQERLEQEQGLSKWVYYVPAWIIDPLLKERKDLLSEKKEEPAPGGASTNAPVAIPVPDQ